MQEKIFKYAWNALTLFFKIVLYFLLLITCIGFSLYVIENVALFSKIHSVVVNVYIVTSFISILVLWIILFIKIRIIYKILLFVLFLLFIRMPLYIPELKYIINQETCYHRKVCAEGIEYKGIIISQPICNEKQWSWDEKRRQCKVE